MSKEQPFSVTATISREIQRGHTRHQLWGSFSKNLQRPEYDGQFNREATCIVEQGEVEHLKYGVFRSPLNHEKFAISYRESSPRTIGDELVRLATGIADFVCSDERTEEKLRLLHYDPNDIKGSPMEARALREEAALTAMLVHPDEQQEFTGEEVSMNTFIKDLSLEIKLDETGMKHVSLVRSFPVYPPGHEQVRAEARAYAEHPIRLMQLNLLPSSSAFKELDKLANNAARRADHNQVTGADQPIYPSSTDNNIPQLFAARIAEGLTRERERIKIEAFDTQTPTERKEEEIALIYYLLGATQPERTEHSEEALTAPTNVTSEYTLYEIDVAGSTKLELRKKSQPKTTL